MLCKITDRFGVCANGRTWGSGIRHTGMSIPVNRSPLLAALLGTHLSKPLLWAVDETATMGKGLQVRCINVQTMHLITMPEVSVEDRIRFAILCALEIGVNDPRAYRFALRDLRGARGVIESKPLATSATRVSGHLLQAASRAAEDILGEVDWEGLAQEAVG